MQIGTLPAKTGLSRDTLRFYARAARASLSFVGSQ
jgi:DNA-binding transcriptional MerR regulator